MSFIFWYFIMRLLVQRVSSASLTIDWVDWGTMNTWIVCYLWVSKQFDESKSFETIEQWIKKLLNCSLWENNEGKLKRSVQDIYWSIMIVSNFTLWGEMKKWSKLDFSNAWKYDDANRIYTEFVKTLKTIYEPNKILEWKFGAMMKVESVNDGPVNIIIDL